MKEIKTEVPHLSQPTSGRPAPGRLNFLVSKTLHCTYSYLMSEQDAKAQTTAYLMLALGAACVSFAPVFVKMLGGGIIGLTAIAFWRTLFGSAILFALAALNRRPLVLPRSLYLWSVLAGFIFFLDLTIWHRSIIYAGAGLSTILANTQVFATAVFSYFVFKEHLSLRFFIAAVSGIIGVVLLVGIGSDIEFTTLYLRGIAFGLITGLVYGSYIITLKRVGQRQPAPDFLTFIAWTSLFCALFTGIGSVFEEGAFMPPDLRALGVLLLLGLVVQALGWWVISQSLSIVPASRAGLILLLQPTLATAWGVMFFAEQLTVGQAVGAVITLGAIYYGSIYRPRIRPPAG